MKKILIVAVLIMAMLAISIPMAVPAAATGTVTDTNTGNIYSTIQAAINAASPGDTINVAAGIYDEAITINKPLTLNGAKAEVDARSRTGEDTGEESIIDPNGAHKWVVTVTSSNVTVDGFIVQNPNLDNTNFGLFNVVGTSAVHLQNLVFRDNILQNPTSVAAENNESGDWGVFGYNLGYCTHVTIEYNLIQKILCNKAAPWNATCAVWPWNTEHLVVQKNKIINCTTFGVGISDNTNGAVISNNEISLGDQSGAVPSVTTAGIRVGPHGDHTITIEGNKIYKCLGATAQPGAGIRIESSGPITVTTNEITNCPIAVRITPDAINIGHISVNYNNFSDTTSSSEVGVSVYPGAKGGPLDATYNWWGDPSGPYDPVGNPNGKGETVIGSVSYSPWLNSPYSQ